MALDFGAGFLAPSIEGKDGGESMVGDDNYSHWDSEGGFIYFIGSNVREPNFSILYNIPDAGNFLFGAAADRMNIGYLELVGGSQSNELLKKKFDSFQDQAAIRRGYLHDSYLKVITPSYFGIRIYDRKMPSWMDEQVLRDKESVIRR